MKRSNELAPPTLAQRIEFRLCWAIGTAVVAIAPLLTAVIKERKPRTKP